MGSLPSGSSPRLVGRSAELALLREGLDQAAGGLAGAAFVHGEAGVGKTRLVHAASKEAGERGFTVLWARCLHFGAASAPYLPFLSALRAHLAEASESHRAALMAASPDLGVPGVGAAPGRMLPAVDAAVEQLAAAGPVLLVVDDLQWADLSSMDLLAYLVARQRRGCAVLVTYRDEELPEGHPLHPWMADVRRVPGVIDLPLGRLSRDETEDQLRAILGEPPTRDLVDRVLARSDGNAYLTELLIQGLDPSTGLPGPVPEALRAALLAAWHRLSPTGRTVVRLLAVAGRPTTPVVLAGVGELSEEQTDHAVREAVGSGVLGVEGARVWFRHPLLGELLDATLLPGERVALHRAFAEVLLAGGDPSTRRLVDLALHFEAGGLVDEAFEHCLRAADAVAGERAYPEEASLLSRAAGLWPRVSPEVREAHGSRASLLADAAEAQRRANDLREAVALIEEAAGELRDEDPLVRARVLVLQTSLASRIEAVLPRDRSRLEEALRLTASAPACRERATALVELGETEFWSGDFRTAFDLADQALAVARECADLLLVSSALGVRTVARLAEDPASEEAARDADEALAVAVESGDPESVALAHIWRSNVLQAQGRSEESLEVIVSASLSAAEEGAGGDAALLAGLGASSLAAVGRLEEARRLISQFLTPRLTGLEAAACRTAAAALAIRDGRADEAEAQVHALREQFPDSDRQFGYHAPAVIAEFLIDRGRHTEAMEHLLGCVRATARSGTGPDFLLPLAAEAAAGAVQQARDAGDPDAAAAARGELARIVAARDEVGARPAFARAAEDDLTECDRAFFEAYRARCLDLPDQVDRWREAVAAATAIGMRHAQAVASYRAAETLLGRSAGRGEAAGPLRHAHELAMEMGAHPLRERCERLAALARVSLVRPAAEHQHGGSTFGLTPREGEVLAQLVAGRTYAEIGAALFISEKTVSSHVSHLLRKTGSANRVELASWAHRVGLVPSGHEA